MVVEIKSDEVCINVSTVKEVIKNTRPRIFFNPKAIRVNKYQGGGGYKFVKLLVFYVTSRK